MAQSEPSKPTCFAIMPISDADGYDPGHFGRVYEFIIKPACKNAGFRPIRADEVQVTNYIVVDILRRILDADMVVCDLSARNSNVLYELGIRQAFNQPVTLIRDSKTPRIFDIQGLRDLEYDETLRIDKINSAVESLTNLLTNNSKLAQGEVNSIIQLLGVKPAQAPSIEVSTDTSLLLEAIGDISKRISRIEDAMRSQKVDARWPPPRPLYILNNDHILTGGRRVHHPSYGDGEVTEMGTAFVTVNFDKAGPTLFRKDGEDIQRLQTSFVREE